MPETVTLPISTHMFWGLLGLGGAAIAIILVFGTLAAMGRTGPPAILRQQKTYGLDGMNPGLFLVLALLWLGLFVILIAGLFGLIWDVLWHELPNRSAPADVWDWRFRLVQLTALTTVLGGVIALPITLNKVRLNMEQTATAKAALFNTKITEAAADLHATRQVSKLIEGKWETLWEDDVVRRNAAIDRLEGLVREEPTEAGRVSRLLSVYVRELSKEFPAQEAPVTEDRNKIHVWMVGLKAPRSDMEKAVQTLGTLAKDNRISRETLDIDLSYTNLRKMALSGLSFNKANFAGANLQGTNLSNAKLESAIFAIAKMHASNLSQASLKGANFYRASLQGAYLSETDLQGAEFTFANLQAASLRSARALGTDFSQANLQRAYINRVKFDENTQLAGAELSGLQVKSTDLSRVTDIWEHLYEIFGDGSTKLSIGTEWPDHWPKETLEWRDFETKWRAWAKTEGFDIPD